MIYINGYVQEIIESPAGFDATGAPIASSVSYGENTPCMWRALTNDKKGQAKDNGYTRLAYEVHINPKSISCKRMRLLRLDGSIVGDLVVQSVEDALIHSFTKIILD